MATCKDCIHYPACDSCWCCFWKNKEMTEDDRCKLFKNKDDYVEVIRCEKCKNYRSREEQCDEGQPEGYGYCRELNHYFRPTFHCGYGERKEGAE